MALWRTLTLVLVSLIVAATGAASGATAGEDRGDVAVGVAKIAEMVPAAISYQGRLSDSDGSPLGGAHAFNFQLWDEPEKGSQVGPDIVRPSVPVANGLFSVVLDVPGDAFEGRMLWLRIQVDGQWLAPRQQLLPAPYALTLRPGAVVRGNLDDPVLTVVNEGLATGLKAQGASVGINGLGMTGVKGEGDIGVKGLGVIGVKGESGAPGADGVLGEVSGMSAVGVHGVSALGNGVVGEGEIGVLGKSVVGPGLRGEGPIAVSGVSADGDAVLGQSAGGTESAAIRGEATGLGYGGHFTSDETIGVYAIGVEGVHGEDTSGKHPGVHGVGPGVGVLGETTMGSGVKGTSGGGDGVEGRSDSGSGVAGISTAGDGVVGNSVSGTAVYGNSATGRAVLGESGQGVAILGKSPATGVKGESTSESGEGVYGESTGRLAEGVLGVANGRDAAGVYGIASGTGGAVGVFGQTNATYGLYTRESLYVGKTCVGCTFALISRNGGASPLQTGDVVSVVGMSPPLLGQETPVLKVARAGQSAGGLMGVVRSRVTIETRPIAERGSPVGDPAVVAMAEEAAGPVATDDYLLVVLQGLVQVRADASNGAISGGDVVALGGNAGVVSWRAGGDSPPIVGQALEPLVGTAGLIWVLVDGR